MGSAQYQCPCCGYFTFEGGPGSDDICPVCGWEDDLSQLRFATTSGGANRPSLLQAQAAFVASPRSGAGFIRDPEWRPLDPATDLIEVPLPGVDYGRLYTHDHTTYYYWRSLNEPERIREALRVTAWRELLLLDEHEFSEDGPVAVPIRGWKDPAMGVAMSLLGCLLDLAAEQAKRDGKDWRAKRCWTRSLADTILPWIRDEVRPTARELESILGSADRGWRSWQFTWPRAGVRLGTLMSVMAIMRQLLAEQGAWDREAAFDRWQAGALYGVPRPQ